MLSWWLSLFGLSKGKTVTYTKQFSYTGYMKILLTRLDVTDYGIFGRLKADEFECVTLERHDIAIPVGTYKVTLYKSPVHGLVPLLHDVPGKSMIEMHEGNYEHNSKGCILLGRSRIDIDGDGRLDINDSKATLKALMTIISKQVEIEIQII